MLTSFGNTKLWPLYMFFANDSKYRRNKQSLKLGEHIAYFQKLPDDFKDFYMGHSGQDSVSQAVLTHCQRELFHEQWQVILDDEFLDAYEHGIVIKCLDGVKHRFYPRILTYSADYPKKIIVASIKNLGKAPCTRCAIPLVEVPRLGMKSDRQNRVRLARVDDSSRRTRIEIARNAIYNANLSITHDDVVEQLADLSLVPTNNAFSKRLWPFGFNLFDMLVLDLLHEVELGVWKSLFMHLLRLMETLNRNGSNELDKRYRKVPTFGIDTIRRFRNNVSDMKQLAARDYEDMLQCAAPVFEGLIPHPHNQRILKLIFTLAHWHGLAKLRMHTDHTLRILDDRTTELGQRFRGFVTHTCDIVKTKELAREQAARVQKELKEKKLIIAKGSKCQKIGHIESGRARKAKKFSLNTYKFHALGHVVFNIRRFGTSDNLSTQLPESYHHSPKLLYRRTNKKNVPLTLARIQMRQARLRRLRRQLVPYKDEGAPDPHRASPYFIGKSQHRPVDLTEFLSKNRDDVATHVSHIRVFLHSLLAWLSQDPDLILIQKFMAKLKLHLLPRIRSTMLKEAESNPENYQDTVTPTLQKIVARTDEPKEHAVAESDRIFFRSNRIYQHQILQINYTTYDLRREQDTLNPSTSRCHFMCLEDTVSPPGSNPHRFSYGRILGIYHANVSFFGKGSLDRRFRQFDFLWVQWFTMQSDAQEPWSACQLDRVSFPSLKELDSIDFLDPIDVLRACHIIPRFSTGLVYPAATKTQSNRSKQLTGSSTIVQKPMDKTGSHGTTAAKNSTQGGVGLSKGKGKTKASGKRTQFPAAQPSVKAPSSPLARDDKDWNQYYINRFVDCDMVMRYHWGLGVGHRYSHHHAPSATMTNLGNDSSSGEDEDEPGNSSDSESGKDSGRGVAASEQLTQTADSDDSAPTNQASLAEHTRFDNDNLELEGTRIDDLEEKLNHVVGVGASDTGPSNPDSIMNSMLNTTQEGAVEAGNSISEEGVGDLETGYASDDSNTSVYGLHDPIDKGTS
ncbi:hypothetical protein MD484_g8926, partial [Candolleomyces efflorescens]